MTKSKARYWLTAGIFLAVLAVILFFTIPAFRATLYFFIPGKSTWIRVRVGPNTFLCPVIREHSIHKTPAGTIVPALILYGLPIAGKKADIKIFPDALGVSLCSLRSIGNQLPLPWVQNDALDTISLEDDIKGWNAEYRISPGTDEIQYTIFPGQSSEISFRIPASLLKHATSFDGFPTQKLEAKKILPSSLKR